MEILIYKTKKEMKINLILIFFFYLILISANFIFSQDASPENNKLEDYLGDLKNPERIDQFSELSGDKKQELWEEARKSGDYKLGMYAENLIRQISKNKREGDIASGTIKKFLENNFPAFMQELDKNGISLFKDYNSAKNYAKSFGIDLDAYINSAIRSVDGFESPDLRWSEKGKNIIGNGKTWLDLEKLPIGTETIKYENRKFILGFRNGGKIIIGEGATNEKGEIVFLSKPAEKFKEIFDRLDDAGRLKYSALGLGEKGIESYAGAVFGDFSTRNLFLIDGKGELVLNENGFEIKDSKNEGVKVRYGDLIFGKRPDTTGESSVKFSLDRISLKNLEFNLKGYAKAALGENFIVHFGNINGLANQISFEDFRKDIVHGNVPSYAYGSAGKINMWFDDSGKLTHVSKADVANGQWLPVTLSLQGQTYLADLYRNSGESVKSLLESANKKEVDYWEVWSRFYDDINLKAKGREIKIDSAPENFLNINGENLAFSGNGNIEILRNLNSLEGINAKNVNVKIGDINIKFSENGINLPSEQGYSSSYAIKDINYIYGDKASERSLEIKKDSNGKYNIDFGEVLIGRNTLLGPKGASADIAMHLSNPDTMESDMKRIIDNVRSSYGPGESLVSELKKSQFDLTFDFYIGMQSDIKGQIIDVQKILREHLPEIKQELSKGQVSINDRTWGILENRILNSIGNTLNIEGGHFSIGLRNIPDNNPQVVISTLGKELYKISLEGDEAAFVRDVHEAVIRTPRTEFIEGIIKGKSFSAAWPGENIGRLWYRNIGLATRTSSIADYNFYVGDYGWFGKNRNSFFNRYIKEKGD